MGSVSTGMILLVLGLILYIWKKKKKQSRAGIREYNQERGYTTASQKEDLELPLFDFAIVANATNDFSFNNKLGEGGFGPIYKWLHVPRVSIDGLFSIKSDVFSFGVLVLKIVSGKKNRGFHHPDHHLNLLGHAWRLHKEGRSLELIDTLARDSCNLVELLRSIHVGLLCVQ